MRQNKHIKHSQQASPQTHNTIHAHCSQANPPRGTATRPTWHGEELRWVISAANLKRYQATGATVKVQVHVGSPPGGTGLPNNTGGRLGWLTLPLRAAAAPSTAARRDAKWLHDNAQWHELTGASVGSISARAETPKLLVTFTLSAATPTYAFGDDEEVFEDVADRVRTRTSKRSGRASLDSLASNSSEQPPRMLTPATSAEVPAPAWSAALAGAGAPETVASVNASLAEPPAPEPAASADLGKFIGASAAAAEARRRSQPPQAPTNATATGTANAAHRVTLRLRSFAAGKRFPTPRARIFARVRLPAAIYALRAGAAGASGGAAARVSVDSSGANVHTTRPAVEVSRAGTADSMAGAATALENANCQVIVHCAAEVLARALAENASAIVEIWMRDDEATIPGTKERKLGSGRVPLNELAEEAWVDGTVPIYAGGEADGKATALVQIGVLQVTFSLETRHAPGARWSRASVARRQPAPEPATATAAAPPTISTTPGPEEYRVAFELETWKRAEQSKFLEHLAATERSRMAQLEAAWIESEERREAQVATLRAEHAALEAKLQESIERAETRERLLTTAEEAIQRKRRDEEREQALRAAEAQAAVRRLQEECEHQLSIEAQRYAELSERHATSTARTSELERRLADTEAMLDGAKRALHAPDNDAVQLRVRVSLLEERNAALVSREASSAQMVQRLKARVVKLARALQHVSRERTELSEQRMQEEWGRLQAYALAVRADATAQDTARDRHAMDEVDHILAGAQADMMAQQRRGESEGASVSPGTMHRRDSTGTAEDESTLDGLSDVRLASSRPKQQPTSAMEGMVPPLAMDRVLNHASSSSPSDFDPDVGAGADVPMMVMSDEAAAVAAERDALLATGVYGPTDALIEALEARLQAFATGSATTTATTTTTTTTTTTGYEDELGGGGT